MRKIEIQKSLLISKVIFKSLESFFAVKKKETHLKRLVNKFRLSGS